MDECVPTPLKRMKQAVLHVAKYSGVLSLIAASRWRQRRLLIIAFHSISVDREHGWRRMLYFTPDELTRRLELLQRWDITVLSLDDAMTRLVAGTLPPRAAVLTFDDGLADFCNISWPALERHGYPATVYVTTYYSDKRVPVFPLMCSYLLWLGRAGALPALPQLGLTKAMALDDDADREALCQHVVNGADADGLTAEEKNQRLGEIADALGIDYGAILARRVLQVMTPEEMAQVAARGADIQLHTHRHRVPLNRDAFCRELDDNRARIEAATGRRADHFCYPSGESHPEFLPWLNEMGVKTSTTCEVGLATRANDPHALPRLVDTASLHEIEVEGWLSGFSQCLLQRPSPREPLPRPVGLAAAR